MVIFLFAALWLVHSDECNGDDHGVSGQFDFYVFQQFWEAGSCYGQTYPGCLAPTAYMRQNLTIHGLWPNYDTPTPEGYDWPQCCPSQYGPTIPQSAIDPQINDLHLYWPDDEATPWPNYQNCSFWNHEWGKHGTCSGLDQQTYLHVVMMNVHVKLPTASIITKNIGLTINKADLQSAYNNGKPCVSGQDCGVVLSCTSGKFLQAVTTCWTKQYSQRICPALTVKGLDTCTASTITIDAFSANYKRD